jgi:hypothetical protein
MLRSEFKEFSELLNLNRVEYFVVVGYALADLEALANLKKP